MTAALLLLAFATVVSAAAPILLARAEWAFRAPRLGIAAWCASALSVVLAFAASGLVLLVVPERTWRAVCDLSRACMAALRGGHGWVGRILAVAAVVLAAAVMARLVYIVARAVPAAVRWRRDHVATVRAVGRDGPCPDIKVIDYPVPAAYVVAGWSRPLVVVTSGAMERLTYAELAAVIAHERAHAAGRHHMLLSALRLLSQAFPASRLFGQAYAEVSRLAEVCADDTAVRRCSRLDLARALVTVAEGLANGGRAPAAALAATGGDAAARVHRLLAPPTPPGRRIRLTVIAAALALPTVPPAVVALARWWPTLAACPQLFG